MKNWNQISKKLKIEIFTKIAEQKGITMFEVEKDWWIAESLNLIFQTRLSTHLTLKGGEAFNKAWNLIDQFSNDIDLSLDISFYGFKRAINTSELKTIEKRLHNYMNEQFSPSLEQKFKDKELTVSVNLKENDSTGNMLLLEIHYTSILKRKEYAKSSISLKIDFTSNQKSFKLKTFSSLVENHYPSNNTKNIPIKIPCVNPDHIL